MRLYLIEIHNNKPSIPSPDKSSKIKRKSKSIFCKKNKGNPPYLIDKYINFQSFVRELKLSDECKKEPSISSQ